MLSAGLFYIFLIYSMKKNFTLGAVAGISAVALAIPLFAQVAGAASGDGTSLSAVGKSARPAPSQECIQALVAKDDAFLSTVDTMMAAHKQATQTHRNALNAAASITDDTQRDAAVRAANEAFHTSMKDTMDSRKTGAKDQMDAIKTACGDAMGGRGMFMKGMMGRGHHGKGDRDGMRMMRGMDDDQTDSSAQ